jgi:hypothetical protein
MLVEAKRKSRLRDFCDFFEKIGFYVRALLKHQRKPHQPRKCGISASLRQAGALHRRGEDK